MSKIKEIKHGVLFVAQQLGTEPQLRKVFDKYDSAVSSQISKESEIRDILYKIATDYKVAVELQQSLEYFDTLPKKRPDESETRLGIMRTAKRMGVPLPDVQAIFDRYDLLLKKATTEEQRQHISYMGAAEIHKLLHVRGALVMDGKTIIPAEKDFVEEDNGKFKKIE